MPLPGRLEQKYPGAGNVRRFWVFINTADTIAAKDLLKFMEHCNQRIEIIRL